jgi:hypothetical protein
MFQQLMSQKPMGLLILIPKNIELNSVLGTYPDMTSWNEFQNILTKQLIDVPVYLTKETPETMNLYEILRQQAFMKFTGQIKQSSGIVGRILGNGLPEFVAFANPADPTLIEDFLLDVMYTLLNLGGKSGGETDRPIIAITTPYDALALSPGLSISSAASGTGISVLLTLAKYFSDLKNLSRASCLQYDLLFVMAPSSTLNHIATNKFIEHIQSNMRERIKLVINLDTLMDHTSTHHQ